MFTAAELGLIASSVLRAFDGKRNTIEEEQRQIERLVRPGHVHFLLRIS
jgi:hypothetical protein